MKLLIKALTKCLSGLICLGLLLFLSAGTFQYYGAWLLISILFVPMLLFGGYLYIKAPALLKKRLNSKEENSAQKIIILLSSVLFLAVFVLCGLDFRFGWSHIPLWLVVVSAVVFLIGYALYAEVMRENAYLSRTVEVQAGQKVIDTGLYGIVRNPMYFATLLLFFATLLLFFAMPLVLGSLWAFLLMVVGYLPIIVWRIFDEEKTLAVGLPGYRAYMRKVRRRLIPFIW